MADFVRCGIYSNWHGSNVVIWEEFPVTVVRCKNLTLPIFSVDRYGWLVTRFLYYVGVG